MNLNTQQILQVSKGDTEIASFITTFLDQNNKLTELVQQQVTLIQQQTEVIEKQVARIEQLELRVKDLERQLGQNSNNSSKPPSSDGLHKPTNLRTPGGKKGAPKGHQGHTLPFSASPDHIVEHTVAACQHCSCSLLEVSAESIEKRQVFDLPAPRVIVTEHRAEKKCCPHCHSVQQAAFPEHVLAPTQYGQGFMAWTVYLNVYQLLPLERITQLFRDLAGNSPSEATLLSYLKKMHKALDPFEKHIQNELLLQYLLHFDETSVRVEGKKNWLHLACSKDLTLLAVHKTRGSEGIKTLGILPQFQGVGVHDCYSPYFREEFQFTHALCGAHLIRECQGIAEYDKHQWPNAMKSLLQEAWTKVKEARICESILDPLTIRDIEHRYDEILVAGEDEWSKDKVREKTGPRGRKIKSRGGNLGERFRLYKEAILRFLCDPQVPFDNNQAERDIRMAKLKQKISGTFRTMEQAQIFARLRSVISTLRKQNRPILASLIEALQGTLSLT